MGVIPPVEDLSTFDCDIFSQNWQTTNLIFGSITVLVFLITSKTVTLISLFYPTRGSEENALSPITAQKRVSYGHKIAARAATPEWLARGGQCIVVQETPGLYPGGNPHFWTPPFLRRQSRNGKSLVGVRARHEQRNVQHLSIYDDMM